MFANIATASLDALLAARDETLDLARHLDRQSAALAGPWLTHTCRCSEIGLDPMYACERCAVRFAIQRDAREEWARYQTLEDEICARISL